jgi:hypothetical protein
MQLLTEHQMESSLLSLKEHGKANMMAAPMEKMLEEKMAKLMAERMDWPLVLHLVSWTLLLWVCRLVMD